MARTKKVDVISDIEEIKETTSEVVADIKTESKNIKFNTKKCPVLLVKSNGFIIDFDGFGLFLKTDKANANIGDLITVKYQSEIGKPDFRYQI